MSKSSTSRQFRRAQSAIQRHATKSTPRQSQHSSRSGFRTFLLIDSIVLGLALALAALFVWISHAQTDRDLARLAELSNSDHGSTIDEVIQNVHADMPEYETIFVFDEEGNKLIEHTSSDPHGVSLPDEAIRILQHFHNLTHLHNHPGHDNGYSDNDLGMLCRTGLDDAVTTLAVVTTRRTYYLERGDRSWTNDNDVIRYFDIVSLTIDSPFTAGLLGVTTIDGVEYYYLTDDCLRLYAEANGYRFRIVTP